MFGIAQPNSSPWDRSVIKFLMGKWKFQGKNRGVRMEMCARKGFVRYLLLTQKCFEALLCGPTVVIHSSSDSWEFQNPVSFCYQFYPKPRAPGCLCSQVRLHPSAAPVLHKC